ncbi:MAG TPA: fasciclin domain-containing protein [Gaiella sp.]|jgi:uncharacterized surface protein with fasciclin (FAS1) repeats|nr:fasciclin domain-containing protein [Gaiella sp.]
MTKLLSLLVVVAALLASTVASAPAQPRQSGDLVQTVVAAGQFKTLARLLTRAGLVGALEKPGPYTVFAPTDAAFAKVPKKTLDGLLADKAKLKSVLLYHVVAGKVTATDVTKLSAAKTLAGASVRIRVSGTNVFVNTARVTKPDVMATNGVIHVVSRVLIPPAG